MYDNKNVIWLERKSRFPRATSQIHRHIWPWAFALIKLFLCATCRLMMWTFVPGYLKLHHLVIELYSGQAVWDLFLHLTVKWPLTLPRLAHNIPSDYVEHLCRIILETPLASDSYGADKLFGTISLHFTLKYDIATQFLRITHRLIIVSICSKLFEILPTNDRVTTWTSKSEWTDALAYTEPPLWQLCWALRKRAQQL
jgi:hypothetical protein